MTNESKLDFLLNYLEISPEEIANRLGITQSMVSQWKNKSYKKFKRLHQYALKEAFDIPLEIFDETIDTEEEIVNILNKKIALKNKTIDSSMLKNLIGARYCYFYNDNTVVEINILEIFEDGQVKCKRNDMLELEGKVIFLDKSQVVISLTRKEYPYSLFILFDSEYILNPLFYAIAISKSEYSKKDRVEFIILSKDKLALKDVKRLLQNPSSKRLLVLDDFIETIQYYSQYRSFFTSNMLDFLKGAWFLYIDDNDTKPEHKLVIKDNYQAYWYRKNEINARGNIKFDKTNVIVELEDASSNRSYFIFDTQKTSIKVFSFKSYIYATKEEIIGAGVMSKSPIEATMLRDIFSFNNKFYFNITKFKSHLEEVKKKNLKVLNFSHFD